MRGKSFVCMTVDVLAVGSDGGVSGDRGVSVGWHDSNIIGMH